MKDLAIVLGIRPDVIRASKILKLLDESDEIDFDFIWSGQHYSENMKDTFFRQLSVPTPNFEFNIHSNVQNSNYVAESPRTQIQSRCFFRRYKYSYGINSCCTAKYSNSSYRGLYEILRLENARGKI